MHQGDSKGAPDALKLSISAGNGLFVQAEVLLKYPTFGGFFMFSWAKEIQDLSGVCTCIRIEILALICTFLFNLCC